MKMKLVAYSGNQSATYETADAINPNPHLNLYRSLHPYPAFHENFNWPARPDDYPIAPNDGSFDVYSRYFTLPSSTSDGGAIKLTAQQWYAIFKKNNFNVDFVKWAVRGTDRIMMWKDGYDYPVFHYPLCFGGNLFNVLEWQGKMARVETWPMGKDVPDNLPGYLWQRCWCVYNSPTEQIRDAPAGPEHISMPCWMLALAHSDSAWIFNSGLLKY